jgi:8-oxo-dGTP diphosphatase
VRREVLEETGLFVKPVALTGVYKNMHLGVLSLVFRCHPTGGTVQTAGESLRGGLANH